MAKDTTRKKALKIFHTLLKAKRTDESNPSLYVQRRILQNKMKQAKKRALRQQREKQAESELQFQQKVIQQAADGYIPKTALSRGEQGTAIHQAQEEILAMGQKEFNNQYLNKPTFKEIIKHGGF